MLALLQSVAAECSMTLQGTAARCLNKCGAEELERWRRLRHGAECCCRAPATARCLHTCALWSWALVLLEGVAAGLQDAVRYVAMIKIQTSSVTKLAPKRLK